MQSARLILRISLHDGYSNSPPELLDYNRKNARATFSVSVSVTRGDFVSAKVFIKLAKPNQLAQIRIVYLLYDWLE